MCHQNRILGFAKNALNKLQTMWFIILLYNILNDELIFRRMRFIWFSCKVGVILGRYDPNWVQPIYIYTNPNIAKIRPVITDRQTENRRTVTSLLLCTRITHFVQRTRYKKGKGGSSVRIYCGLKCKVNFLSYIHLILLRHVSAARGHHQAWVLLKLLHCMLYFVSRVYSRR